MRENLILDGAVWGKGPSSPCRPLFIKARGRAEQRHDVLFVCFFIIFFQHVPIEPKPPHGTLTMSFTLLLSGPFSRLVIISQAPRVGSLSSFLRNDYLQTFM